MPPLSCLFIPASQQIPIAPRQLAAFQQLTAMDSKKRRRATVSSSECSPDDGDDSLHSVILAVLKKANGDRRVSKKKLKKAVTKQVSELSKKEFKRALKELVKNGKIVLVKDEKTKYYRLAENDEDSVSSSDHSLASKNSSALLDDDSPEAVPIAMRLRGESIDETKEKKKKVAFHEDEPEDLDDEIARLERELANDNSDDESEDEEDDSSQQSNEEKQPTVLSLSKFSDDRVESLPTVALPEPGRYDANGMPIRKKKKRKLDKEKSDSNATNKKPSGLEQAVKEVLSGYQARSSERLPFYCRFCAKQYDNETDFFAHKSQDFHKTAVEAERKATYCKFCRVQLTSPVQMKEHLKSRPHKERLQTMRNKQQGGRGGETPRNSYRSEHHVHGRHAGRGGGRYAGDRGRVSRV